MNLQKNLIFLLKKMQISKQELSKLCKIPYMTLSDIIKGTTKDPRISLIINISLSLNISIDDLLLKDLEKENE